MKAFSRITPESAGIESSVVRDLLERLDALEGMHSIILMRHGKIFLEGWWRPFVPETPHMLFSLGKSFTSLAVGIAADERKIRLPDRLAEFFPEHAEHIGDARMREVTLHHLLSMTTGHARCAREEMERDPEGNYARGFLSSRLACAPGERFAYNSAATYMLAAVIKRVTGENVREFLQPRVFAPLGIAPGIWECDPQGVNLGGWGLSLTTEDIARFAELLLRRGERDGRQIVSSVYLSAATGRQADTSRNEAADWKLGYGYQFWQSQYGYRADGSNGQFAIVIPDRALTVSTTASVENMQDILTALWEGLVPHLEDAPLPENAEAFRRLQDVAKNLSLPVASGLPRQREVGRVWDFESNPAGIRSCAIAFGEDACALTFFTGKGCEQIRAGFGRHLSSVFQLTDHSPHPTAASAAWVSGETLEIETFCLDGPFRDVYRIRFSDPLRPLTRISRCSPLRPPLPDLFCR